MLVLAGMSQSMLWGTVVVSACLVHLALEANFFHSRGIQKTIAVDDPSLV
jgi:hypothetical protein